MRKLRVLLGLVVIVFYSGVDLSGFAGEISDMNAYLVQATCPSGLTPNNCAYANQTKDLITTPLAFRRLDWPGAYSGIISDNVLDPSTGAVISTFKTTPFDGTFNPPNDGGDVYMNDSNVHRIGDAAIAVKTQTGSLTPIYFVGYTCGYTMAAFPAEPPYIRSGMGFGCSGTRPVERARYQLQPAEYEPRIYEVSAGKCEYAIFNKQCPDYLANPYGDFRAL